MSADTEKEKKEGDLPEIPLEYISIGASILAVLIAGGVGVTWWLSDQKNINERKQRIAEQKRMLEYRRQWEEQQQAQQLQQQQQQQNPEWPNNIDRNTIPQVPVMTADGHRVTGGVLDTGDGYNEYGNYGSYSNEDEQYIGTPRNNVSGYREPMPTHNQPQPQPRIKTPKLIGNKISKVMSMDENDNYPDQQRQYRTSQDGSEADDLSDIV